MPVKIRKANQHMAMFSVDADAAQRMIDYSGLQVCRYLPGRAIVVLMLMHYIDGDLGQYLRIRHERDGQPARLECKRAPRPAFGRRLHPSPSGRPSVHFGSGTNDLGLPEGDGRLHRSRRQAVRIRRQHRRPAGGRHGIPARACRFRRRSSHASRCTARTRIATVSRAKPSGRRRLPVCATGRAARGCGSAITRTPRNSPRLACRNARWCRVLLTT